VLADAFGRPARRHEVAGLDEAPDGPAVAPEVDPHAVDRPVVVAVLEVGRP